MAFAKWEPPSAGSFVAPKAEKASGPKWWKASFTPGDADAPLYFDAAGLSKGQLYINGRHLCRYFVTAGREKIGPQQRYFVPRAFIRAKQPNELMIFDESGESPTKARLVYG
jgi:hypothetical protein